MMNHHDEDDGPCNRHAAGSIEPRRRVDYRAKKHPRPAYKVERVFQEIARKRARAAARAAQAGAL